MLTGMTSVGMQHTSRFGKVRAEGAEARLKRCIKEHKGLSITRAAIKDGYLITVTKKGLDPWQSPVLNNKWTSGLESGLTNYLATGSKKKP